MILYTEEQLDNAYRLDCKARTKSDEPWITREQFRSLYEDLITLHMEKAEREELLIEDVPEWVINSIDELLEKTLTLE
tara:strand:- start:835 stop:1068 length:234 start_codon:yes stop_codon:yes gene_type:complete